MGKEGNGSRYYYQILKQYIPERWNFRGRKNYGAEDPYNIVLNYLFGILYSKGNHALTLTGLDLKIGILHGSSRNGDSLLYDFIEQFRFIVWELTFTLFSRKLIQKSFFDENSRINSEGKKLIVGEFYKKFYAGIPQQQGLSYYDIMKREARDIAKEVLEYEVFDYL